MKYWNAQDSQDYNVVVVGAGATGLMAAATAAHGGRRVAVLEKAEYLGGTSAISGGTLWVPCNKYLFERGLTDSSEEALKYLRTITKGHTSEEILQSFVEFGPEMIEFAAKHCELVFDSVYDYPDYRPDLEGSVRGGRSLDPKFYDTNELDEMKETLRTEKRPPFTMQEYEQWVAPTRFPWDELQKRAEAGLVARGGAVVAPLINTCRKLGVTFVTEVTVERLVEEEGCVRGVVAGGERFNASSGVVLACGGFEWNEQMTREFLAGPLMTRCSPPNNTGDGIRMATKLGAKLGNMREAWWSPMADIPGDEVEGEQVGTLLRFERQGPGSIIVDKNACRFVNESQNYNDMTRAFHAYDPVEHEWLRLPAHIVFDQEYLELYGFLTHRAEHETPTWIESAKSLEGLGAKLGIDGETLRESVERFNRFAKAGRDLDFKRGEDEYDRYWGDEDRPYPNPSLAPLEKAPYYAVEIVPGGFGTNGGIVTDARARAQDADGEIIEGLYAVGNTTAHPMGGGYSGAGATLGPGMTMGYLAGKDLVRSSGVERKVAF